MSFLLTTCQPGAEKALKDELIRKNPGFKLAYSRPGFVTFKTDPVELEKNFVLSSVFAFSYSVSVGKTKAISLLEKCTAVLEKAAEQNAAAILVYSREKSPTEKQDMALIQEIVTHLEHQLQSVSAHSRPVVISPRAPLVLAAASTVLEVILVESEEWWFGVRNHQPGHRFFPTIYAGGCFAPAVGTEKPPSRAYFKLLEVLALGALDLKVGQRVLDLGCAPGGSSLALIEKGAFVYGVDPGAMDEVLLRSSLFKHLKMKAEQVSDLVVTPPLHWIYSDMNIPGDQVIRIFKKLMKLKAFEGTLQGGALNLKLQNLEDQNAIARVVSEVVSFGFRNSGYRQLYHNATEIALWFSR